MSNVIDIQRVDEVALGVSGFRTRARVPRGLGNFGAITLTEIENELLARGYYNEANPPHILPPPLVLTDSEAVKVGVDFALDHYCDSYNYQISTTRPRYCPTKQGCPMNSAHWNYVIDGSWGAYDEARGYAAGTIPVPTWAEETLTGSHGAHDFSGIARTRGRRGGFGRSSRFGFSFDDFLTDNPWLLQIASDALETLADHYSDKALKEAILAAQMANFTPEQIAQLVAGVAQAYPDNAADIAAIAAETGAGGLPSWVIPAAIGGGVLMVVMMMR